MKETKGITLIALIITIIVLLILAGVALATLTGEGSIIQNAENAVAQYNNKVIEEQIALNNVEKYLENGSIDSSTDTSTSTSTGKSTLLWEEEYTGTDSLSTIERTISIENLDKYKYVYLETDVTNSSGALSGALIPVQILLEDNTKYRGDELTIKYISDDTFFIEWTDLGDGIYRIYGVE